eukprot:3202554-Rhodomonas_salina.1
MTWSLHVHEKYKCCGVVFCGVVFCDVVFCAVVFCAVVFCGGIRVVACACGWRRAWLVAGGWKDVRRGGKMWEMEKKV